MFRYRSGHQGSSQSLIMHCMFRPLSTAYTQYTPDGARPLHLLSQHPFSFMKNVLLVYGQRQEVLFSKDGYVIVYLPIP